MYIQILKHNQYLTKHMHDACQMDYPRRWKHTKGGQHCCHFVYYLLRVPCLNFNHVIFMKDFYNVFTYYGRSKPKEVKWVQSQLGTQKECLIWNSFLGCTILNDHYVHQFIYFIDFIFFVRYSHILWSKWSWLLVIWMILMCH